MRQIWVLLVLCGLLPVLGCPNQVVPPPDDPPPPKGSGVLIQEANLAPATERAEAGRYVMHGHLKASSGELTKNGSHQIRGGLVPLAR